jgi:hypothetical protein
MMTGVGREKGLDLDWRPATLSLRQLAEHMQSCAQAEIRISAGVTLPDDVGAAP